jgi:putative RecB family exonuclease
MALILSPSKAGSFTKCAKAYKYQYVDELETEPSYAQILGIVVHRALELYVAWRLGQLPASVDSTEACFQIAIGEQPKEVQWLIEPQFYMEGLQLVDAGVDLLPDIDDIIETELRIHEAVGGYELHGVIDRVDHDPLNGTVTLVDYKTGKIPSKRDEKDRLRALMLYSQLWNQSNAIGAPATQVKLVYLRGTPKKRIPVEITAQVTAQGADFAARRLTAIGDAITECMETDDWRANTGPLCAYCPFINRCPEGTAWVGQKSQSS